VAQPTFRILGRLEILVDGRPVNVPSRRERALLGLLLLHAGEVVSIDTLIDSVWGDPAPTSARHMVHEYVSRLRSELGGEVIATRPPGYSVLREACELDADEFTARLAEAREFAADDQTHAALRRYEEALGLWRGDVLADVGLEPHARVAGARLDAERRAARSERIDMALALGRHSELVPELESEVGADPLDEHLLAQLMLALYRTGRQADALSAYRAGRARLVDELGIEPSGELRRLEQAILRHDPSLDTPARATEPAPAPAQPRRRIWLFAAAAAVAALLAAAAAIAFTDPGNGSAAPVRGSGIAIVDAARSRLLGSIPLDAQPSAMAFEAGSLWVAPNSGRTVTQIDAQSRRVVGSATLDRPAVSLTGADGKVWAIGASPSDAFLTLERIDPAFDTTKTVKRLPTVVSGDTGSLTAAGHTLIVAPRTGYLTRIDTRSGRVLDKVDPNAAPVAIVHGFGSTWLAYPEADLVVRVDGAGAVTQIPVGHDPSALAVGRHAVWVADTSDGNVRSIDPTGAVITTVKVGTAPTALAEDDGSIWVANSGNGTLTRIDEKRNRPSNPIEVGGSPSALVVADGTLWVAVKPQLPAQPSGGTLRVSVPPFINVFDPAVENTIDASSIEYALCLRLMNYPDKSGAAALRLVPDAARTAPTVSRDGRTYTFVIRSGFRFSPPSNEPVTAGTFKHTIERSLSPAVAKLFAGGEPPGRQNLPEVVGAASFEAGKAAHISGITARGNRLTIRLAQAAPDLPAHLAADAFCAIPSDMPATQVGTAFPSAGPYYIAAENQNRDLVLLRNPNYHGDRPRRPRRIVVAIGPERYAVGAVEAGKVDYAIDGVPASENARLERLYGHPTTAASPRYLVSPQLEVDDLDLNTSRPLFASERMRQAASYAIDRKALADVGGTFYAHATPTEMSIPPGAPGYRVDVVYPLVPDLAAARRLAGHGHHTAILLCLLQGGSPRAAQIVAHDLAAIGITVQIHCLPGDEMYTDILNPHYKWDLDIDGAAGSSDPGGWINPIADFGAYNVTHLHDPKLNAQVNRADHETGLARAFAYAKLDDELLRDVNPWLNFANEDAHNFFSARVSCLLYQPTVGIDLGALCIRKQ
jgi:ABC-type transport system substrate-binding protein/DNA-binding SARP family transcriptional activator